MVVKRRAPAPADPSIVQPGRLPAPGAAGSFQERLDGGEEHGDANIEVRRWTAVRDEELEKEERGQVTTRAMPRAAPSLRPGLEMGGVATTARLALAQALYQDSGSSGSMLEHPGGRSFTLKRSLSSAEVHAPHAVSIPLPQGHSTSHEADLAMEVGNATLMVDVLPSHASVLELKARAYDALQLRRQDRALAILVHVRCSTGMSQEQVEAIGHGYDIVYGVDESRAHELGVWAALVARITAWAKAAGPAR